MFPGDMPARLRGRGATSQTWLGKRVPPGARLVVCVVLAALAFGARSAETLAALTAVNALHALLFCGWVCAVWRDGGKLFAWQTATIVGLYLLRFGGEGLWPGIQTSGQLFLAFLPGMVFLQSVPQSRLVQTLNRIMPYQAAFVLCTSMRFIPLVLREVRSIHEAQLLRGARILPRDLLRPWNWPDLVHCVLVPAVIQSLALAAEIAAAARARDFGTRERRTYWPGA